MADDKQYQYIKLPDGSYGKFLSDATDEQIRAAISKDFPDAFKTESKLKTQAKEIGRESALGAASGAGIPESTTPIQDLLKNVKETLATQLVRPFTHPGLQSAKASLLANPAVTIPKALVGTTQEAGKAAGLRNVNLGPGVDVPFATGMIDLPKMAHDVSSLLAQIGTLGLGGKAVESPATEGSVIKPKAFTREFIGLGKAKVGEMAEKRAGEIAAKKGEIKQGYAEDLREREAKAKEASAAQSKAETKRNVTSTKQGPVYQRMTQTADAVQQQVQRLDKTVRQQENAKWDAFKKPLQGQTVNAEPIAQKIDDVQNNILSTESVPIFKKIMDEIQAEDPLANASVFKMSGRTDMKELLRSPNLDPTVKQRILDDLRKVGETPEGKYIPKGDIDVDYLRRLSTKIGERMYGASVSGDVYRALKQVQGQVESVIKSKIEETMGPQGVKVYDDLKNNWRRFMETFYDKDSPVQKLKNAKDPNDKLNPITGDEGQRAINLLNRYKNVGSGQAVSQMGNLRALQKSVKELPGTVPKVPPTVERPSLEVEGKPTDPESIRRELLKEKIRSYATPTRWEIRFPPLRAEMLAVKKLLESPTIQKWLINGGL